MRGVDDEVLMRLLVAALKEGRITQEQMLHALHLIGHAPRLDAVIAKADGNAPSPLR